jgi:hypothetical protein
MIGRLVSINPLVLGALGALAFTAVSGQENPRREAQHPGAAQRSARAAPRPVSRPAAAEPARNPVRPPQRPSPPARAVVQGSANRIPPVSRPANSPRPSEVRNAPARTAIGEAHGRVEEAHAKEANKRQSAEAARLEKTRLLDDEVRRKEVRSKEGAMKEGAMKEREQLAQERSDKQKKSDKAPHRDASATGQGKWSPGGPGVQIAKHEFALHNGVKVTRYGSHASALTLTKPVPGGGSLSMKAHLVRGKLVVADAHLTRTVNGKTTSLALDGSRLEKTAQYARFTSASGYSFTTFNNGLHRATTPGGKPMFSERYQFTMINDVRTRIIERTVFRETVLDRLVTYDHPIIRRFYPNVYAGVQYYVYQPVFSTPVFYQSFYYHFHRPFFVRVGCFICPPPVVGWVSPPVSYVDPLDLLGDLMISTAVADSEPPADPDSPPPPPDPEVAALQAQVAQLQQQVNDEQADNTELHQQLTALQAPDPSSDQSSEPAADQGTDSAPSKPAPQPAVDASAEAPHPQLQKVAYTVPQDVRAQIHEQVKEDLKLQEQHRDLTWPDVVASGKAKSYVFQVSDTISTADSDGAQCSLSGGDLLKLDDSAAPDDPTLQMRVITAKATSCPATSVVSIGVADAQGMLNDFNAREQTLMQKVEPQLLAGNNASAAN